MINNQETRHKIQRMTDKKTINKSKFDLEERTTKFACKIIRLCKRLKRNPINNRLIGQIVGSSGSIGANYREANDALGKKDFIRCLKIARREAKETYHWLKLLIEANPSERNDLKSLIDEVVEYKNILSAIIKKMT